MPIKIPNNLPAVEILAKENIFVMKESRALSQDIRPLKFVIVNLMPTKIETETQLLRLLSNTPLQIEVTFLKMASYVSKNTSKEHMANFYKTFDDIKNDYFDGLIITGAPVENLEFEEVIYWNELTKIMKWSKKHVYSTISICWGAQASLYYHYGIKKYKLEKKDKLFTRVTASGKKVYKRIGAFTMIKKYGSDILGYDWVSPHTFRHTRAIHLLSESVDVIKVQKFLAHKSVINTLVYLQYVNRDIEKSVIQANASIGIY